MASSHPFLSREPTEDERRAATELHRQAIVVDTVGALLPTREFIDGVRAGGVTAIGVTVVLPPEDHDFRYAVDSIVWWNRQLRDWSRELVLATSANDIRQAKEDGRIAVVYLFQNGKPFEDEPGYVEVFRHLGVTSSQLTYNQRSLLGDGYTETHGAGLSDLGRRVVAEMNRVGMLVDGSHANDATAQDLIEASASPVYFSHSGARALAPVPRFASDETLRLLASQGGNVSTTGLYPQLPGGAAPTLRAVADDLLYLADLVGSDRVSFATDFLKAPERVYRDARLNPDGFLELEYPGSRRTQYYDRRGPGAKRAYPWWTMPAGIEDYAAYPNLTLELVLRGCAPDLIRGILGGNYLRLYGEVVG